VGELDEAVFHAYLDGLRQGGWDGDQRVVRLGMTAASVKYAWLLPQMLEEASDPVGRAYWREVDPTLKYAARGKGMIRMVNWADEALRLADQLGR
ncbi:MAG: aminoglycoside phosphotransferase, partial [Acidimicrobiales bacterium]